MLDLLHGTVEITGLEDEIREALTLIRDQSTSSAQALSAAFGIVDEFFGRTIESTIQAAYDTYSSEHHGSTGKQNAG